MKRSLFVTLGFAITCMSVAANAPANAAPSTYQNSCRNMKVVENVLEANCLTRDGQPVYTNLVLQGIENIDGRLRVTDPYKDSNFHQSCYNVAVRGNVLQATCRTRNGRWRNTSLALNGIENIDGSLRYTSDISQGYARRVIPQMW